MRCLVLVAILSLFPASFASAADLPAPAPHIPVKAPAMFSPAPVVSWSGFYAGLHVGYGFGTSSLLQPSTGIGTGNYDVNGAVVGGQLGYNVQFNNLVAGIETDLAWSGIKGDTTLATACATACETKNTWLGTTRARLGVPMGAAHAWLPYVTAGIAYGGVKVSDAGISRSETPVGWTAGAGVDYRFARQWSGRLEYLYVDLGSFTTIGDGTAPPFDVKYRSSIVRGAMNYHF
jgi:outer membrane immunogenic protein